MCVDLTQIASKITGDEPRNTSKAQASMEIWEPICSQVRKFTQPGSAVCLCTVKRTQNRHRELALWMFKSAPLATGWRLADSTKLSHRLPPSDARAVRGSAGKATGEESFVCPRRVSHATGGYLAWDLKSTKGRSPIVPAIPGRTRLRRRRCPRRWHRAYVHRI